MTIQIPTRSREAGAVRQKVGNHPHAALAAILIGQMMLVLDGSVVNIALPDIGKALDLSPENLSWTINAYSLAFGGLLLLGARMGDLLGHRRVFVAGIALFTVTSLLGGLSQNAGELLAARAAQGVGAAFAAPTALALLMTQFPEGRKRARAIGLYSGVSIGSTGLGLVLGGLLVAALSWRWILFVNVPVGVALIALARVSLPENARRKGRFDLFGALSSTAGMTALVFGFVRAATDGWGDVGTIAAFAGGVVLLVMFVANEARAEAPITPLRLFDNRTRNSAMLARLLMVAASISVFFFLTQFLQVVRGYSALAAGVAFLPLVTALFIGSLIATFGVANRIQRHTVMKIGATMSTLGILSLTQLSPHTGYPELLPTLIVFGLGNGITFVSLTAAALARVPRQDSGAASGLVNVAQQLGGSLGLSILVTLFGATTKNLPLNGRSPVEQAHHVFTVGVQWAFAGATAFFFLTLLSITFGIRKSDLTPFAEPPPGVTVPPAA